MKHVIVTLLLALASTLALAEAEQASTPASAAAPKIVITEEQKVEIRALVEAGSSRRDARLQVLTEEQLDGLSRQRATKSTRADSVLGKLDLSDEQKAQIAEIRANGGSRKDVRAVLTAEQVTKYDEMRWKRNANKEKSHKAKNKEGKEDKE